MADSGQSTSYTHAGGVTRMSTKRTGMSTAAATTDIVLTLPVELLDRIAVQVDVTTRALDAFVIKGKFHKDGAFVSLYSAGASYTSPAGLLLGASGDLTAQGAGTTGWFIMDVRGLYEVQVLASGTIDGTGLISAYANGS